LSFLPLLQHRHFQAASAYSTELGQQFLFNWETSSLLNLWNRSFESRKNPTTEKPQIAFLLSEMNQTNLPKPGWLAVWKKLYSTSENQDPGHTEIVTEAKWENGEIKVSTVGGNTNRFLRDGDPADGEGVFLHANFSPKNFGQPNNQFRYEFLGFVNPFPY
jgi:hypothetical protein